MSYLLGQFDPATHPDFVSVGKPYSDRPGMRMRKEAFEAFKKMYEAARDEGVNLKIISSTRNFAQQKAIWEGKWERLATQTPDPRARALRILEYSSMPGTSRHHWGADIDLNDLNDAAFVGKGAHRAVYEWLSRRAGEFGFCMPYSAGRATGYQEEKWHWSYMPLSSQFLSDYERQIRAEQISGFRGDSLAATLDVVNRYVSGIAPECRR
ncbi:MAG: M15 family metallopeptidase [Saprospiraceae bacterium]